MILEDHSGNDDGAPAASFGGSKWGGARASLASPSTLVRRASMAQDVVAQTDLDGHRTVDLAAWRRHSVAMISELIEEAVRGHTLSTAPYP